MTLTSNDHNKKRHFTRNIAIIVVILLVVAAGTFIAYSNGLIGSSSLVKKSNPLSVSTSAPIDDQPAASQQGYTVYVYQLKVTDVSSKQDFVVSINNFNLVTNTNSVYPSNVFFYWQDGSELENVTLGPNQNTQGTIAFQFPISQTPSYLEYSNAGVTINVTNISAPNRWVSEFDYSANISYNDSYDILADASIPGLFPPNEYLNGQTVLFSIYLSNLGNSNITINSVTVTNPSLRIYNMSPSLPVTIYSDYYSYKGSSSIYFYVNVTVPSSCFIGTVTFSISLL
jgi:hypothetical protein